MGSREPAKLGTARAANRDPASVPFDQRTPKDGVLFFALGEGRWQLVQGWGWGWGWGGGTPPR